MYNEEAARLSWNETDDDIWIHHFFDKVGLLLETANRLLEFPNGFDR
jgi:hypothetical protein